MAVQSAAPAVLHGNSAPWEQAAAFLRSRGLAAPTTASKFNSWLVDNVAARAALLSEFPSAAVEVGLEVEVPVFIGDLRANPPAEPSVALGRKVLDQNLSEAQLRSLLVDRPALLQTLLASIEQWRDYIAGPHRLEEVRERMAATAAANQALQAAAANAGPAVVMAVQQGQAAERKALIRRAEALRAKGLI